MKSLFLFSMLALIPPLSHGAEHHSIYFASYVRHFQPQEETRDGSMDNLGYSAEFQIDDWQIEPGINTFIDSYNKRSYSLFTDISHEHYAYPYYRPVLSLSCMYKGIQYSSDEMALRCYPLIKFRIGDETKLFANIVPIPHVGDTTNGFIAVEIGYKW